jgi:5-methylcytosine-specific restriction protein A
MPTINKPKKQSVRRPKGKEITTAYNRYRKLRQAYLIFNPLCQDCLLEGKTTPATQVHHLRRILSGNDELEMIEIATDPTNLMGLCEYHHNLRHSKEQP